MMTIYRSHKDSSVVYEHVNGSEVRRSIYCGVQIQTTLNVTCSYIYALFIFVDIQDDLLHVEPYFQTGIV